MLATGRVDMNKLVAEARRSLGLDLEDREIEWRIDPLPPAFGDAAMLRQTLVNLISNAAKYTRPRSHAQISIYAEQEGAETVYSVRDNGVGFDMAYADKLFGVFQRLHRAGGVRGHRDRLGDRPPCGGAPQRPHLGRWRGGPRGGLPLRPAQTGD